jgi:hypothetical protein
MNFPFLPFFLPSFEHGFAFTNEFFVLQSEFMLLFGRELIARVCNVRIVFVGDGFDMHSLRELDLGRVFG